MINERNVFDYCDEDISNIENYSKAINDATQTWVCHHRREITEHKTKKQLVKENLYYFRPANELIFLTTKEHAKLHGAWNKGQSGIFSKESLESLKRNCSISAKGKNNPMYGSTFIWINNGKSNRRHSRNLPIPIGWIKGFIQKKKH